MAHGTQGRSLFDSIRYISRHAGTVIESPARSIQRPHDGARLPLLGRR
jgi:hypothetical protein